MFNNLLAGIFSHKKIESEEYQIEYLKSLRPVAQKLRKSYQKAAIDVNYSDESVQMVYLLRYFPFYHKPLKSELEEAIAEDVNLYVAKKTNISATFFCSGPLPEAVGLCNFLHEYNNKVKELKITSLDLHHEAWEVSRNIVLDAAVRPILPDCKINVNAGDYDLSAEILDDHLDIISTSDLIVFQNCLNEISAVEMETFKSSLNKIMENMPKGSVLILIERSGYGDALNVLRNVSKLAEKYACKVLGGGVKSYSFDMSEIRDTITSSICGENLLYKYVDGYNDLVVQPKIAYNRVIISKPL